MADIKGDDAKLGTIAIGVVQVRVAILAVLMSQPLLYHPLQETCVLVLVPTGRCDSNRRIGCGSIWSTTTFNVCSWRHGRFMRTNGSSSRTARRSLYANRCSRPLHCLLQHRNGCHPMDPHGRKSLPHLNMQAFY